MKKKQSKVPTGFHPRPREYLEMAESMSKCIRKDLQQIKAMQRGAGDPVSVADALAIAQLIIDVSQFGGRAQAADAIMIAEQVERLFDRLGAEIDFVLAAHNHHASK